MKNVNYQVKNSVIPFSVFILNIYINTQIKLK